jgi:hypothetical protein
MKINRVFAMALAAVMALICVPGKAAPSDPSDVMAAINHVVAAFDAGIRHRRFSASRVAGSNGVRRPGRPRK